MQYVEPIIIITPDVTAWMATEEMQYQVVRGLSVLEMMNAHIIYHVRMNSARIRATAHLEHSVELIIIGHYVDVLLAIPEMLVLPAKKVILRYVKKTTLNSYIFLSIAVPVHDPDQCKMDADCPSKLACFSGLCKNPCYEAKPCAQYATCTVQDTLPLRTMFCVCDDGYAGDAERLCSPGLLQFRRACVYIHLLLFNLSFPNINTYLHFHRLFTNELYFTKDHL